MKARCSHCGHIQTLKRTSARRKSREGKAQFQCSNCHRYSTISESKVTELSKGVEIVSDQGFNRLLDWVIGKLENRGVIKRPKTREEIETEKLKQKEETQKRMREEELRRHESRPSWI